MKSMTVAELKKSVPENNPLGTVLGSSSYKRPFLVYCQKNVRKYWIIRRETNMLFCDICGFKPYLPEGISLDIQFRAAPHKRLVVDHCHKTLIIRGLLCPACNQGLGHFRDIVGRLLLAARYIIEFKIWYPVKARNQRFWGIKVPKLVKKKLFIE